MSRPAAVDCPIPIIGVDRMKTLTRYKITALVTLAALLPVFYRTFPDLALGWQVAIALLIALIAGYVEHTKNVRPQLELKDRRTYLFGYACDDALAQLHRYDPTARLNIFEVDPRPFWRTGVFETIYTSNMERAPDLDLRLRTDQGVSGQAFGQKEFTMADLEVENGPTFNLTPDQQMKTKDLTLVLSMPIKKAKRLPDRTFALTDEVIGVVNIDSRKKQALNFYRASTPTASTSLLELQQQTLVEISEICSYIIT